MFVRYGRDSTGSAGARCDQPSFPHHHRRQRNGAKRRGQMGGRHLKQPVRAVSTAARTAARRGLSASGPYVVTNRHESMQCLFGRHICGSATSAEQAISSVGFQRRNQSSGKRAPVTPHARLAPVGLFGMLARLTGTGHLGGCQTESVSIRAIAQSHRTEFSRIRLRTASCNFLALDRSDLRSLHPSSEPRHPAIAPSPAGLPARRFRRLVTAAGRPGSRHAPRQARIEPVGLPGRPARCPARPHCPLRAAGHRAA